MNANPVQTRRKPKDRDFIETVEGLLFCVVDYLHPPDRITAYLKYSPASRGRWQRGGQPYHRELAFYHAHQVTRTLDELKEKYPHYIHYCPVRDLTFSMVPEEWVRTYYCPEERLWEILQGPRDPLEEETARVAEALCRLSGLPISALGVTGSILLGIHDPSFSDIDLTVLGRENSQRLRRALLAQTLEGSGSVDEDYVEEWCRGVVQHHGLTYNQARWLVERRWNFVHLSGGRTVVSLHPTRADDEINEVYGAHFYRDAGMARIRATVTHAEDAIFLPAIVQVEEVCFQEGRPVELGEIWTYEGLFGGVAAAGERVEARGKLESIDGGPRHRLVVGSSHAGPEYLLPAELCPAI